MSTENSPLASCGPAPKHMSVFTGCTNSGQRKDWRHIQVSSCGYTVRPVARAIKTKHAGLDLGTWATSYKLKPELKLDRLQAITYKIL